MTNGERAEVQYPSIHPKEIPIVALSAKAFEEDRKKSIESGMNDHVAKPIGVDKLMLPLIKCMKK